MVRPDGEYAVCCYHRPPHEHRTNINRDSFDVWQNSKYLKSVQDSFAQDQRHPGCHMCWHHEEQGIPSQRQRTAKEYQILGVDTAHPQLTNIELDVGNLCNLKCLMCDEYNSSAILAENRRLGINVLNQRDIAWHDSAFKNLKAILDQKPAVINIRGGEPLYNKKLLELVQSIPDDDARAMCLHITTNATVWDDTWQQALQRFRLIRFMFSIDAVGNIYEYIRYPASWSQVSANIDAMIQPPNVKPMIHTVVSNLNIGHLGDLIEWASSKNIFLELDALIDPQHLQIQNLPAEFKTQVLQRIEHWLTQNYPKHIIAVLQKYHNVIAQSQCQPELWKRFKQEIGRRDQLRGNSYRLVINDN